MPRTSIVAVVALAGLLVLGGTARAQSRQITEEPTDGIYLPATPLAGDQDARAVSLNPAGLQFLGGTALTVGSPGTELEFAL